MHRRRARLASPASRWVRLLLLATSGCSGTTTPAEFCDDFCDACDSGPGFEGHTESCEDNCNRSLGVTEREAEADGCEDQLGDWLDCRSDHESCAVPATEQSVAACKAELGSLTTCIRTR